MIDDNADEESILCMQYDIEDIEEAQAALEAQDYRIFGPRAEDAGVVRGGAVLPMETAQLAPLLRDAAAAGEGGSGGECRR